MFGRQNQIILGWNWLALISKYECLFCASLPIDLRGPQLFLFRRNTALSTQGIVKGVKLCFRYPYFYFRHGENTSTASQLTSPASQKSKDLNKDLVSTNIEPNQIKFTSVSIENCQPRIWLWNKTESEFLIQYITYYLASKLLHFMVFSFD